MLPEKQLRWKSKNISVSAVRIGKWNVLQSTVEASSLQRDFCTDTLRFLWIWRHQMDDPDPHLNLKFVELVL